MKAVYKAGSSIAVVKSDSDFYIASGVDLITGQADFYNADTLVELIPEEAQLELYQMFGKAMANVCSNLISPNKIDYNYPCDKIHDRYISVLTLPKTKRQHIGYVERAVEGYGFNVITFVDILEQTKIDYILTPEEDSPFLMQYDPQSKFVLKNKEGVFEKDGELELDVIDKCYVVFNLRNTRRPMAGVMAEGSSDVTEILTGAKFSGKDIDGITIMMPEELILWVSTYIHGTITRVMEGFLKQERLTPEQINKDLIGTYCGCTMLGLSVGPISEVNVETGDITFINSADGTTVYVNALKHEVYL